MRVVVYQMNSTIVNYHVTQKLAFLNPGTGIPYNANEPMLSMSVKFGAVSSCFNDVPRIEEDRVSSIVTLMADSYLRQKNTILMCLSELLPSFPKSHVSLVLGEQVASDRFTDLHSSVKVVTENNIHTPTAIFLDCEPSSTQIPGLQLYFSKYTNNTKLCGDLFYTPFCEYMDPDPFIIKVMLPELDHKIVDRSEYENAVRYFHNVVRTSLYNVSTEDGGNNDGVHRDNCFDCSYEKLMDRALLRG